MKTKDIKRMIFMTLVEVISGVIAKLILAGIRF